MRDADNQHFVSIIIPALDEEKYISKCLMALRNMAFPKEQYEIILVDNGSRDGTVEIAKEFGVEILEKPDGTIGSLRNYGAKHATGSILGFIDADCQVSINWLRDALHNFACPVVAAVGCRLAHDASTWVAKSWSLMHSAKVKEGETHWLPSGNMVVRRKYYDEVNGFDERLRTTEDYDLCQRLRKKGYVIYSDPKVASLHLDPPTHLSEFFKKELWHGKEMIRILGKKDIGILRYHALLYAILYVMIMIGIATGSVLYFTLQNKEFLIIFAVTALIFPLGLAFKTLSSPKKLLDLPCLTLVYMVYGLARALCLLDIRNYFK